MKNIFKNITVALMIATTFVACKKDKKDLQIPDNYDGANFTANTVQEEQLKQQLTDLSNFMKAAVSDLTITRTTAELNDLFNAGTLSLNAASTTTFKAKANTVFANFAVATGNTWNPTQGNPGGKYGSYIFDGTGAEPVQQIEKGLFGAALYNYAVTNYLTGTITLEKLDKALSLYGATPAFVNSNDASKHGADVDKFLAGYAARRDDNAGSGVYLNIKKGFIKAQAAIKAGNDYNEERDEAIAEILLNWEKALAGTVVNYCFAAITSLSVTSPTAAELSSAMHGISEGASFFLGLKTVSRKYASDTQLDAIMLKLRTPDNGTVTAKEFANNPVNGVTELQEVIATIKSTYGFSTAEIEAFKKNWVSEQQR